MHCKVRRWAYTIALAFGVIATASADDNPLLNATTYKLTASEKPTSPKARWKGNTVRQLQFTPDGTELLSLSVSDRIIRVSYVKSGKERANFGDSDLTFSTFAMTPDGKTVVALGGRNTLQPDPQFIVYDLQTEKKLRQFPPPKGYGIAVSLRMADKRKDERDILYLAGKGPPVAVDLRDGEKLTTLATKGDAELLALSPDGAFLAVVTQQRGVLPVVWDIAKNEVAYELKGYNVPPDRMAFSPDSKELAVLVTSGIAVYEVGRKFSLKYVIEVFPALVPLAIAYSPDGGLLAIAGGTDEKRHGVLLWDRRNKAQQKNFFGKADAPCQVVAFSPDGKTLAVSGQRGDILFFDVPSVEKGKK